MFYKRRIEGRTVPEIAVALNMTPKQVRLRDYRMMRAIPRVVRAIDMPGEFIGR